MIKKRLQHKCFPVNITNYLGTVFLWNTAHGCFLNCLRISKNLFDFRKICTEEFIKAREHEYIYILEVFLKFKLFRNISNMLHKNNFPIFLKYKKTWPLAVNRNLKFHVSNQPSLIWNSNFFTEIKENLFKLREFTNAQSYLNNYMVHVEILLMFLIKFQKYFEKMY